jgi:energy-coupling factor transporter ATP-binding protein EcfA2
MSDFFDKVGTKVPPRRSSADGAALSGTAHAHTTTPEVTRQLEAATASLGDLRWSSRHDSFWGTTQTHDSLPPGLYRCNVTQMGPTLERQSLNTDNLLELPDDATSDILAEFDKFWGLAAEFEARGFMHKRGYLLYGPPGSGKTSAVALMVSRLIKERSGVVLLIDHPQTAAICLSLVRKIEPERPLIAIMEDLDALVQKFGENEYLSMLDGEAQVNGICFLATSNYPEYLDKRFVDRPSRFDTIRMIPMPSADARRVYLEKKETSLSPKDVELWVRLTDGFSVAHLKELIIAVKCLGQPLKDAVERLEEMRTSPPKSSSLRFRSLGDNGADTYN